MKKTFPLLVALLFVMSAAHAQRLSPATKVPPAKKAKPAQVEKTDAEALQAAKDRAKPPRHGRAPAQQSTEPAAPAAGK